MQRPFDRFWAIAVLGITLLTAPAASAQVVSTRCRENEVALDPAHTVSLLGRCGEQYSEDLLWHLDRIDDAAGALDGRFDRHNGGAGAVVYVMDTGIRADHVEFVRGSGNAVIAGYDVSSSVPIGASSCRQSDKALAPCYANYDEVLPSSHGTGVASIIAGANVGVAPDAKLVSVRVMNERGLATTRSYLDGLNAIIQDAWDPATPRYRTAIVNISAWVLESIASQRPGDPAPVAFAEVERKIREMIGGVDAKGRPDTGGRRFFFVVAANNLDGGCGLSGRVDRFPAVLGPHIDGLITVGGMTPDNTWWAGGCRGGIEVLAPAQSIFSATITARNHYRGPGQRSGTSFAAPIISGIAARLLSDDPDLTPQQLETLIETTPSRIDDAERDFAGGKVACIVPILPSRRTLTASVRLAP